MTLQEMTSIQLRDEMKQRIGKPEVNDVIKELVRRQREYNLTHPATESEEVPQYMRDNAAKFKQKLEAAWRENDDCSEHGQSGSEEADGMSEVFGADA